MVVSRTSSSSSLDLSANAFNAAEQRRTRRRITATQLAHLEDLYRQSSHPSRDQRDALAKRIQMETKSVTIWFQNKRQLDRKVALHNATNSRNAAKRVSPTVVSATSGLTLDRVASRSEIRFTNPSSTSTPTRSTSSLSPPSTNDPLWATMLSSPLTPSSPPSAEFAAYIRTRKTRSLEWACAAAGLLEGDGSPKPERLMSILDAHMPISRAHSRRDVIASEQEYEEATAMTETEDEAELVTPHGSQDVPMSWEGVRGDISVVDESVNFLVGQCEMMPAPGALLVRRLENKGENGWEEEEVHAALALCGLRG